MHVNFRQGDAYTRVLTTSNGYLYTANVNIDDSFTVRGFRAMRLEEDKRTSPGSIHAERSQSLTLAKDIATTREGETSIPEVARQ